MRRARKSPPSLKCTICQRAADEREPIDAALRAGRPLKAIADVYGLSKSTVHRLAGHVGPAPKRTGSSSAPAPSAPGVAAPPPSRARVGRSDDMIAELTASVRAHLVRLLDEDLSVWERSKLHTSAVATLQLLTRLDGRQLTEVQIMRMPAWQRMNEATMRVLAAYPDALDALEAAYKALVETER